MPLSEFLAQPATLPWVRVFRLGEDAALEPTRRIAMDCMLDLAYRYEVDGYAERDLTDEILAEIQSL